MRMSQGPVFFNAGRNIDEKPRWSDSSVGKKCAFLMHLEWRFRYENCQLFEFAQQGSFQLGNEAAAAARMKVERRHDDNFIEVQFCRSLPDAFQGKLPLLHRHATEA